MSRFEDLLAVQEHDTRIDQLEHRRRSLPERAQLAELESELAVLGERGAELAAQRDQLRHSQQRLEDEVASLQAKASRTDSQLYGGGVVDPRQLQYLEAELAALRRRIAKLEDDVLAHMEAAEPLDAEIADLEERSRALGERAGALRQGLAAAEAAIESGLGQARAGREAAAGAVPDVLLAEYDALRARLGGVAIARLVGGTCQGCRLALAAMELDRIKRLPPDEPVHCEECGRLLVR